MVDYKTEIKAIAEKTMTDPTKILDEFNQKVEDYIAVGAKEDHAQKIAFKQIKGAYQMQLRSKAIPMEGFFVGVTQKRNKNKYAYEEAMKEIEKLKDKYKGEWKGKALSLKMINEKGEPLYHAGNTTAAQEWMRGQVIHEVVMEKVAYGFFRAIVSEGQPENSLAYGEMRISAVDDIYPELLKFYQFRASCKNPAESVNCRQVSVTKLEEVDEVSYDLAKELLESKFKFVKFNDAWDFGEKTVQLPDGQQFYITEVTCVGIRIPENADVNFVEFQSMADDDYEDNISMTSPKVSDTCFESAVGLALYRPYFKKNEEQDPTAQLIGFLVNETYGKAPKSPKKISDEDFE